MIEPATEATNPLLDYNRDDAYECAACDQLDDTCPYHQGVNDGIALTTDAIRQLAGDPDKLLLAGVSL